MMQQYDIATRRYLRSRGIPPHLAGYVYLADLIDRLRADPSPLYRHRMCLLYSDIGRDHGRPWYCVERSIRWALGYCHTECTPAEFCGRALDDLDMHHALMVNPPAADG